MSDIFMEVKDELRQQKLQAFWQENRDWIIGGVILAIVSTAGMSIWRVYDQKQDMTATAALFTAQSSGAAALEELSSKAPADHAVLARLAAAALHVQKGEADKALAIYDEVANSRADRVFRDLAALFAASHRLSTEDPKKLHDILEPLAAEKSAWRFTAMELQALLFAREGKMAQAAEKLSLISGDAEAPQDARTRAFTLREFYLTEAAAAAPAKSEEKKK